MGAVSMSFNFDEFINRIGTHSSKWDNMQARYGVAPDDGLAMWVADMDFRAPPAVEQPWLERLIMGFMAILAMTARIGRLLWAG